MKTEEHEKIREALKESFKKITKLLDYCGSDLESIHGDRKTVINAANAQANLAMAIKKYDPLVND